MEKKSLNPVVRWLFLGYFLIFIMVIVGGVTRLTGSGLSMADWKPIMGAIPPLNETDWQEKFELYKATPEFKIKNNFFNLSEFKSIFWWEFIHRNLGRLIGLVFIIPFLIFWFQKRFDKRLLRKMFLLLALGSLQGFLGWYMVSSGLVDDPNVSHFRLAAHFSTALTAMMFTFWVAITIIYPKQTKNKSLHQKTLVLLGLVVIQIIYGAFTAGMDAGFGYTAGLLDLPKPVASIINDPGSILMVHRYLAIVVIAYTLYLFLSAIKKNDALSFQKTGLKFILGTVSLQVLLGVFTLLYSVPLALGVLHQVGAILVLTSCFYVLRRS